ncbi:tRNA glutamyl-Q(34) synthetase GluQRS [Roseibium sp.]|uniref:tRNA glutamyl-Q(34) synthetase GluQRS n=1 Tax=Roseibium sp. TaxID=1936156 RepID=UPI003A977AD0
MQPAVFRFAPSPNGHLHLGHALSAWLNHEAAKGVGGRFLVRVEDIDTARCTPALIEDMFEDLAWLGLSWEQPVYRQSEHFDAYAQALATLEERGLVYRAYLTRSEIKRFVAENEAKGMAWPCDPDGAPLYPGDGVVLSEDELAARKAGDAPYAIRLDMKAALGTLTEALTWWEGPSEWSKVKDTPSDWYEGEAVTADPAVWGDVILARKDTPTSYHLSVVVDDAVQGITDVLRGRDLYHATSVHRLLQHLLGLKEPRYRHHELVRGLDGRKLSKSDNATSLRFLRASGAAVDEILGNLGTALCF